MTQFTPETAKAPYLLFSLNGLTEAIPLETNSNLFVGSGSNCKIQIDSPDVGSIQCMLLMDEALDLKVQDWNTGKTTVNGNIITDTIDLHSGDTVVVGEAQIVPVLDEAFHQSLFGEAPSEETLTGDVAANSATEKDVENGEALVAEEPGPTAGQQPEEAPKPSAREEVETVQNWDTPDEFVYNFDADLEEDKTSADSGFDYGAFASDAEADPESAAEENQILLGELDQLRFALADRDAKIRQLQESQGSGEVIDSSQTEQLVCRLEDLLTELEASDSRVRGLEDLLRASDQATETEREERSQLERWVTELEQRVTNRESESQAEIDRLSKRLGESIAAREQSQEQLQKLLQENLGTGDSPSAEIVQDFHDQLKAIEEELAVVRQDNEQLRSSRGTGTDAQSSERLRETEQKLAQIQLDTSRERAEMSRQRAELKQLKSELEERLSQPRPTNEADAKIRAMRQHFNDIHEREMAEKASRRSGSLGGRIQNLLGRVGKR